MASQTDPPPAQQVQETTIPVEDIEERDSAYAGSTHESDTTSLASSILNYRWEHGRRYHAYKDGEYWGPNDEKQLEAEDFLHQMFLTVLERKLHLAPLPTDIHRVLDVGTGTGIWAIDFADQSPSAQVIGIDLSPVQPSFVPPNCQFEVEDANAEWTYASESFDFVHIRMLTGSISDWPQFYKKVYNNLKPGAWIEQVELSTHTKSEDGTVTDDMPFKTWEDIFSELGRKIGKTFQIVDEARPGIEGAGFTNVQELRLKLPIGTWSKDKKMKEWGMWNRVYLEDALEGFALRGLTSALGWSYAQAQLFLVDMRKHLRDPAIHAYIDMSVVWGQKPVRPAVPSS